MLTKQLVLLSGVAYGQGNKGVERVESERRYSQLVDMMTTYNPDFDERKYWSYGCNCLILGDRPMSDPGHGAPVDDLDKLCKAYKDCLKCTRREHGPECIGEFVQYKYAARKGNIVCRNQPGTCGRNLCECDAMFAKEHVGLADVYTDQFHAFFGDWKAKENCFRSPKGTAEMECCGGRNKPFQMFNAKKFDCCEDGTSAPAGTC